MMLAGGSEIQLTGDASGVLTGALQVTADGSYRVALADAEGLTSRGDTEYFIRTLEDRPPEVHVVRPASDRLPPQPGDHDAQKDNARTYPGPSVSRYSCT